MIFWLISLFLLVVAVLCILVPLRGGRLNPDQEHSEDSLDIYREQLAELDAANPLTAQEKQAIEEERIELSRRLIRHSKNDEVRVRVGSSRASIVMTSLAALVLIPAISISTYLAIGSPQIPDQPLSARLNSDLASKSIDEMLLIAKQHLQKNPGDRQGWQVLADTYGALNRPAERAVALRQLSRLSNQTPELMTELGEALTVAQGNIVPAEARELFQRALAEKPAFPKASLYLALALEQEGKFEEAYKRWVKLAAIRKSDERWQTMASARLKKLGEQIGIQSPKGPTQQDIKNAATLSTEERAAMIEGMVAGLESRLEDDPNDIEGWMRLIRSYKVLNNPLKAAESLVKAKSAFSDDAQSLKRLDQFAARLKLTSSKKANENNTVNTQ